MIATVTLNPCLDKHITVNGLRLNETNRWTNLRQDAGGKGIDVSRAIHIMGGETMAYGFIGGHEGRTLEIMLAENGVPFSFTPIRDETRTCFIITDSRTGQQTKINAPGPQITRKELDIFSSHLWQISPKPQLLVAAGSIPPGCPDDTYYSLTLEAKGYGVRTVLDSAGRWMKKGIEARPYLIKPNVREAEELVNARLADEEAIIGAAHSLVEMGIDIVAISRGKDGIIAASAETVVKAVAPPVRVKSTVGAGDSAVAGLSLKLAAGEPLSRACQLAVAMGTAAVLTPGTELCRRADVVKLLPLIRIEELPVGKRRGVPHHAGR
jgi:6-phosphofructokinase 2